MKLYQIASFTLLVVSNFICLDSNANSQASNATESYVGANTKSNLLNVDFSTLEKNIMHSKDVAGLPSGTAIAVIKGDKVIYQGYFGYADIAHKIKVTNKTPFYIASATKPFFALNTLLDINSKQFEPTLTLAQMFPTLDIADIDEQYVTLKHLMTHTSAVDNLPLVYATAFSGIHDKTSLKSLVLSESIKTEGEIGEFNYTNVGYNIFSVFADEHFNAPWQHRLQQQVFKPLKMQSTSAQMSVFNDAKVAVAKPYSLLVPTQPNALYLEKTEQTMHAAGGIVSTASDLAQLIIAELNNGVVDQQQVLPADVIKQSQQKQVSTDTSYLDFKRDGYAWGCYTGTYQEQPMLHHFGGFAGTHAHMSFMPEQKIGLIVLNNEDFLSARMTSLIADFVYGTLLQDMTTKQRVDERFMALNQKLADIDKMLDSQNKKIAARKMNLSLPDLAYQGEYVHPLLGKIWVMVEADGAIRLRWGVMNTIASGFDKLDQMRITFLPTSGEVIKFTVSDKVESLHYDGMTFTKVSNNS